MFIKAAAVQYTDPKTNITKVWCGYDHNAVYDYVAFSQSLYLRCKPDCCDEGFMTSEDTFISRSRALEIAKDADQLKDLYKNTEDPILYSYMLKDNYQACVDPSLT